MGEGFQPYIPHMCSEAAALSENGRPSGSDKTDLLKSAKRVGIYE